MSNEKNFKATSGYLMLSILSLLTIVMGAGLFIYGNAAWLILGAIILFLAIGFLWSIQMDQESWYSLETIMEP